jgi:uncharacterized repeat protein (TIGR01451 family)
VPASATTDSTGVYTMYMAVSGGEAITVTERDEPGYVSTRAVPDANMVEVDANRLLIPSAASGTAYRGDFGDVWASDVVTITGQVWEDADVDGAYDLGAGLGGAIVSVQDGMTQTTDATGDFMLYARTSAAITVTEQNPVGYWSTNALPGDYASKVDNDTLVISLSSPGSTSRNNRFGDAPIARTTLITGVVFDDENENGVLDAGEGGLAGVTVTLEISGVVSTIAVQTDPAGRYQFASATWGWAQVTSSGPGDPYYATTLERSPPILLPAGIVPDVNFGYSDDVDGPAVIAGAVFDDANSNKIQDFGEPGLAGAVVTLDGGASITTTGDGVITGTYRFTTTVEGVHSLHEQNPPGYPDSTTPDDVRLAVVRLEVYEIMFGDADRADVTLFIGTVFDDLDVDGSWDLNEPGLAGVTVTMASGLVGPPEAQVTNEWGQYGFTVDTAGTYTVTETDPDGYVSTNAIPGAPGVEKVDNNALRTAVAALGGDLGNNLFGDVLAGDVITVSGTVWDDDGTGDGTAGDGVRHEDEQGLAGAVVSLDTGMTQTTGLDGAFLLYGPPNAVITVTEKNPAGYVSTGAEAPDPEADVVDYDTIAVSGLITEESSTGNLFGDARPAELTIDKQASSTTVFAGAVLTYTLVYSNDGPSYAQDVYLVDVLTGEVAFGGVVSQPGEWDGPPSYDAGPPATLTWYTSSLPSGASGTIVFTVTVDSGASGVVTNSASIYSNMPDTSLGGNEDQEVTGIDIAADLGIEKAGDPKTVAAGERLTYTLRVTNHGPSDATGVVVTDTLPVGVVLERTDPPVDREDGRVLEWDLERLADGTSETFVVVVVVDSDVAGAIENVAEAASATFDPTEPNVATESTWVGTEADLWVTKSDSPHLVSAGTPLTYYVSYGNDGPADAQNVCITDTLPDDVTYVDVVSQPGGWDGPTYVPGSPATLSWCRATLTVEESEAIVFAVMVNPDVVGSIANSVLIASDTSDPAMGNNAPPPTVSSTFCEADDYEEDDTSEAATGLSTGVQQSHNFCDDDTDWLAVQTRAGYVYTVTTSSVGQRADTFLALFKSDGSTLLAENDDYEGTEDHSSQIAWKASVNGTYYVQVTNRAGLVSGYTEYEVWLEQKEEYFIYLPIMLQKSGTTSAAEVEVLGVIEHTCADDYETDDTWQLAQPAELGVWQEYSFDSDPTWYAADKDFVWFEIKERQTIVFTVSPVEGTETLLELWDEDGNALNVEGSTQLVWTALAGGRYYLSVSPLTRTYGCAEAAGYDLLVEMAPRWEIYLPFVMRSSR